jgi:hypothetical protein
MLIYNSQRCGALAEHTSRMPGRLKPTRRSHSTNTLIDGGCRTRNGQPAILHPDFFDTCRKISSGTAWRSSDQVIGNRTNTLLLLSDDTELDMTDVVAGTILDMNDSRRCRWMPRHIFEKVCAGTAPCAGVDDQIEMARQERVKRFFRQVGTDRCGDWRLAGLSACGGQCTTGNVRGGMIVDYVCPRRSSRRYTRQRHSAASSTVRAAHRS